jgi:hypothetical protein
METRKNRLDRLRLETHKCEYCQTELTLCDSPPLSFADGLGWGDLLLVCLNDSCSLYVNGWKQLKASQGKTASARFVKCPDETNGLPMLVCSSSDLKNSVVNFEEEERKLKRQSHKRIIELHSLFEAQLSELQLTYKEIGLTENSYYVKTMKGFVKRILNNYLCRRAGT